jgi:hypothetical protein
MADPRWLDPDATAAYLCVRVEALGRLVRQGKIPAPTHILGERSPRWDRLALDAAFEGGAASTDPDEMVRASVQKILQTGRARRPVQAR